MLTTDVSSGLQNSKEDVLSGRIVTRPGQISALHYELVKKQISTSQEKRRKNRVGGGAYNALNNSNSNQEDSILES